MKKWILSLLILIILITPVYALGENKVNVYFFYGQGCPHCASEEPFLNKLEEKYDYLNVERYEVYQNDKNRELFQQCSAMVGINIQGVPTTFIDAKPHIGFSDSIGDDIESEIQRCSLEICTDVLNVENENPVCDTNLQDYEKEETVGHFILAGILIIILIVILNKFVFKKNKKKRKGNKK